MSKTERLEQEDYYLKSFMRSLKKRLAHRREWAIEEKTSSYRLFDRENNIPLTIDYINEKYAVAVAFLDASHRDWQKSRYLEVIQKALGLSPDRLFYKERLKGERAQYTKPETLPTVMTEIEEHELFYSLNLTDYLDMGLFMDHRPLRGELKEHSHGKRVLNLFSYTGSFGVVTAAGGAAEVINVDLSQRYLDWAKQNFQRNGLLGEQFRFIRADALSWMSEAETKYRHYFDTIICDPPAFSNSRQMDRPLDIQKGYITLIESSAKLLKRVGGVLYFSSPLKTLQLDVRKFPYLEIKEITSFTVPYDFRKNHPHRCWQIRWRKYGKGSGIEQRNRSSRDSSRYNKSRY
ncbi:class I SAM-dependent methyltransferase [Entomospira entomophila]|uniref:Methyltransferase domain-containing protein n=1 Tax=Entomospira entomophila TaxID=2719988 RepID=A0A968GCX3_9SPIO|nr:class I SAM-dependent methyltransferase [Entomospira entomophilus]NIZ41141.1 methyltransferase domain-containing protein [Entomospira entomophilus]WDI35348.1 class I SAM-dependent methyltransferase [Entomospira entomophilus]